MDIQRIFKRFNMGEIMPSDYNKIILYLYELSIYITKYIFRDKLLTNFHDLTDSQFLLGNDFVQFNKVKSIFVKKTIYFKREDNGSIKIISVYKPAWWPLIGLFKIYTHM